MSGAWRRSSLAQNKSDTEDMRQRRNERTRNASEALPRFNHSVPEFILNRFAVDGKICVFDKHTLKAFRLPPRRAMGERDFHNVRVDDAIISFENRFTYFENLTAPIIAEIIREKTLDRLGPMDIATLNMFVILQLSRSKSRRVDQTAITAEIRRRWPDIEINPTPDRLEDAEFEKLSSLKITFDTLEELTKPLVTKHTFLMVRNCRDDLYISDSPVVMHNPRTFGPYGNIGIAVPGIEIYFPLSPDVVLGYFCPSSLRRIEEEQVQAEKRVSTFFGTRVLSPEGISRLEIHHLDQMRAEIRRSKDYYHLLKQSRLVPIDSEGVLFLNSLQVGTSYRFVAAARSNFSFVKKALSERPHWKEGRRIKVN